MKVMPSGHKTDVLNDRSGSFLRFGYSPQSRRSFARHLHPHPQRFRRLRHAAVQCDEGKVVAAADGDEKRIDRHGPYIERAADRRVYTQLKILNAPGSGSAEISVDVISSWKRSVAI